MRITPDFTITESDHLDPESLERIFRESTRPYLLKAGEVVQKFVRARARRGVGVPPDQEVGGVSVEIVEGKTAGEDMALVYGTLPQHWIDEKGLAPNKCMPPWDVGTDLYEWASKKFESRAKDEVGFYKGVHGHSESGGYRRRQYASSRARDSQFWEDSRAYRQKYGYSTSTSKRREGRIGSFERGMEHSKVRHLRDRIRFAEHVVGRFDGPDIQAHKKELSELEAKRAARSRVTVNRSRSFLVARAIYEKGIKPTQPFSKGLADASAQVNEILEEAKDAFVRAINGNTTR